LLSVENYDIELDFIDFVELLNQHEFKYMVIGAYVLSFQGGQNIEEI